ncbi:MAG: hypothetical protein EON98_14545 [Chitinophagaceae bacterium]|nr:MAG: hypothetical protein EON98_14545 [Chitinophagaceae bacterium]
MRLSSILREIAVIVYFLIFFKGIYVNFPLMLYLLFTVGNFGTAQQFFSAIAFVGLIIHFLHPSYKTKTRKLVANAIVLAFLLTPLVQKLVTLPLARFNYRWFIIPSVGFFLLYVISLWLLGREIMHAKQQTLEMTEQNTTNV